MDKSPLTVMMQLIASEIGAQSIDVKELEGLTDDFYDKLYRASRSHDLAHIVGNALNKLGLLPDGEVGQGFRKQVFIAVARYESLQHELLSICQVLDEIKVAYIPLKGSVIRQYYPDPWLRTSCDIDILVHEEDVEKARDELMARLNYTGGHMGQHDVGMYAPSGMHIELHYTLIEHNVVGKADVPLQRVWEHVIGPHDGSYRYDIEDSMFYYYHIAHMAKHFVQGGCGVRPFVDLAVLQRLGYGKSEETRKFLQDGEILKFAERAEQLAAVWFGGAEHNEVTRRMEYYMLLGGTYGSLPNRVTVEQIARGGRWKYLMSRVWIKADVLKFYYPSLEKHRRLILFYQMRRWLRIIFTGRLKRPIAEIIINRTISGHTLSEAKLMMSDVGIDIKTIK